MRKDASRPSSEYPMMKHDLPRIVACEVEQRHLLIIALLVPGVLSVLDNHQALFHIHHRPFGFADLLLAQCRCNSVSDDPTHRYELPRVGLKILDELVEFISRGPSVALFAFSDQVEVLQSDARQASFLGRNVDAVHRGGVCDDRPDE